MSYRSNVGFSICSNIANFLELGGREPSLGAGPSDAKENKLNFCLVGHALRSGFLKEEDFERAVQDGILRCGHEMFMALSRSLVYPHAGTVPSPAALAYRLRHGQIPPHQMGSIVFPQSETLEGFMQQADGLLEEVMSILREDPLPGEGVPLFPRVLAESGVSSTLVWNDSPEEVH